MKCTRKHLVNRIIVFWLFQRLQYVRRSHPTPSHRPQGALLDFVGSVVYFARSCCSLSSAGGRNAKKVRASRVGGFVLSVLICVLVFLFEFCFYHFRQQLEGITPKSREAQQTSAEKVRTFNLETAPLSFSAVGHTTNQAKVQIQLL